MSEETENVYQKLEEIIGVRWDLKTIKKQMLQLESPTF
jgi:hypothetical protein